MRAGRGPGRACGRVSGVRILVVEDEPKMTALLARALTEEGHTVDTAAMRWRPSTAVTTTRWCWM